MKKNHLILPVLMGVLLVSACGRGTGGTADSGRPEDKTTIKWFRVRKIWKDSKTQKQLTEMCRKAV